MPRGCEARAFIKILSLIPSPAMEGEGQGEGGEEKTFGNGYKYRFPPWEDKKLTDVEKPSLRLNSAARAPALSGKNFLPLAGY